MSREWIRKQYDFPAYTSKPRKLCLIPFIFKGGSYCLNVIVVSDNNYLIEGLKDFYHSKRWNSWVIKHPAERFHERVSQIIEIILVDESYILLSFCHHENKSNAIVISLSIDNKLQRSALCENISSYSSSRAVDVDCISDFILSKTLTHFDGMSKQKRSGICPACADKTPSQTQLVIIKAFCQGLTVTEIAEWLSWDRRKVSKCKREYMKLVGVETTQQLLKHFNEQFME